MYKKFWVAKFTKKCKISNSHTLSFSVLCAVCVCVERRSYGNCTFIHRARAKCVFCTWLSSCRAVLLYCPWRRVLGCVLDHLPQRVRAEQGQVHERRRRPGDHAQPPEPEQRQPGTCSHTRRHRRRRRLYAVTTWLATLIPVVYASNDDRCPHGRRRLTKWQPLSTIHRLNQSWFTCIVMLLAHHSIRTCISAVQRWVLSCLNVPFCYPLPPSRVVATVAS